MGASLSKKWQKEVRHRYDILILGLDGAGKTSLLYKWRLGETVKTVPTIAYNTERIKYEGRTYNFWDVGGHERVRGQWSAFLQADLILYVVDASDRSRLPEASRELRQLSAHRLGSPPILILGNKQDCLHAAGAEELVKALQPEKTDLPWRVALTSLRGHDGKRRVLEEIRNMIEREEIE